MYIKDLTLLGRDLKKTIIIDNLYESFMRQPDNGILIANWYDDMEDQELVVLISFLKSLVGSEDVREDIKNAMKSLEDSHNVID